MPTGKQKLQVGVSICWLISSSLNVYSYITTLITWPACSHVHQLILRWYNQVWITIYIVIFEWLYLQNFNDYEVRYSPTTTSHMGYTSRVVHACFSVDREIITRVLCFSGRLRMEILQIKHVMFKTWDLFRNFEAVLTSYLFSSNIYVKGFIQCLYSTIKLSEMANRLDALL